MQSLQGFKGKLGKLIEKLPLKVITYNKQHLDQEVAEMQILDSGRVLERGVSMGLS